MTTHKAQAADNVTALQVYVLFWVAVAAASAASALAVEGVGNWQAVAVLAVIGGVAEGRSMPVTRSLELSVAFIPVVLAAVLFGPGAGALVALACMAGDRRGPAWRWVWYASSRTTAGVVAGAVALGVADSMGSDATLLDFLVISMCAALAMMCVDFVSNLGIVRLRRTMTAGQLWQLVRPSLGLTVALYTPLVALYGYAYSHAGMIVLAFFAIPLLAAHLSHSMFARQRQLIDELTATNARLEHANQHLQSVNLSFAAAMVTALDERDTWTAGHSVAVATYSRDIAAEMGLTKQQVELVHLTGLVHDIGKIGVPAEVLQKTAALTDDEWALMREHSEIGARILGEVEDYAEVAEIVLYHHERLDGAGYPRGLTGDRIPLLARVIAVADAYNAMTSDRPYRRAMDPDIAITQLRNGRGGQFDPDAVEAFLKVLERESDAYRRGKGLPSFTLEAMRHRSLAEVRAQPGLRAAVA